jgi:DNA-binding response OmpR family regulator
MYILLVDDDQASARLTTYLLTEEGYRVRTAATGQQMVAAVAQQGPDLILLDVSLPDSNGFDLCRTIRRTSDVPIIYLTGHTHILDRVTGLQVGGDDYLCKPFEATELLARIAAVLRRATSDHVHPAPIVSRGGLALDVVTQHLIRADGQTIQLTAIECRILHYLIVNAGQVLTVVQLLAWVWGEDSHQTHALLTTYIHRLRTKIEPNGAQPQYLVTVRNVGYMFVATDKQAIESVAQCIR